MPTFFKISTAKILVSSDRSIKVSIDRYKKQSSKKIYFAASCDGKRLSSTMFSRLGECESDARKFMIWLKAQKAS